MLVVQKVGTVRSHDGDVLIPEGYVIACSPPCPQGWKDITAEWNMLAEALSLDA